MERPVVKRRLKGVNRIRKERDYSIGELREVGLDGFKALEKDIPFDRFRKTKHEENAQRFKQILH